VSTLVNTSRRDFLKGSAGLALGVVAAPALAQQAGPGRAGGEVVTKAALAPNAFVRVAADGSVTVVAKHLEMGQGVYTGLATIVAEELDADWAKVRVEGAPADARRYNNLFWGEAQGTGGSTAMANSWEQLRKAGAGARAMLVQAAAQRWNVPVSEITVSKGVVSHAATKRKAGFGELAAAAGKLAVPQEVKLKDPKDFVYVGKAKLPRVDVPGKTDGTAVFTQDVHLPGMLTALVAHPPRFGATPKSFDASAARKVPGVVDVVQIPTGVAVLARDFWSAKSARDALKVEWDESSAFRKSSEEILADYRKLAETPGKVARREGDAEASLARAAKVLEARYEFPYLAHAAMEPMNCVMRLGPQSCEVWNGEQFQTGDQFAVAGVLGLKPEQVKLHMLYAGGSFGRRANPHSDYVVEAAHILKATGGKAPVKLVWTREDDMRGGMYRPLFVHALKGGIDANGNLVAWRHRLVGQSILAGTAFEKVLVKEGIDATSVEGASTLPYAIPNLAVELHSPGLPVTVQWWRSVGSTHTAYATEVFLDELAAAASKDPVALRRALLGKHPRHLGVLDLAVEKAGWTRPLTPGKAGERRGRGVAVHESFNSFVAQVAEVTVKPDGSLRVDRVVCAVDCGVAINPDIIASQMEGGLGYGLAAALHSRITLEDGVVQQSNFHDYPPLRMSEMPAVKVHIVPSAAPPTGVGEPGTPVIAPAVANAVFAATGQRLRALPFDTAHLKA
jgi:isoquinoline 1-oxidoreductase beta subunit